MENGKFCGRKFAIKAAKNHDDREMALPVSESVLRLIFLACPVLVFQNTPSWFYQPLLSWTIDKTTFSCILRLKWSFQLELGYTCSILNSRQPNHKKKKKQHQKKIEINLILLLLPYFWSDVNQKTFEDKQRRDWSNSQSQTT